MYMPIDSADIVALDAQAVRTSVTIVARSTAADLGRPTPCAGWTLRDLLAHMTAQHYGFAAAADGHSDLAHWRLRPLGDDAAAGYAAAADHVLAAFAADGVLDQAFTLPEITRGPVFPARQAISFHFIDYVVHSWDIAVALGAEVGFEPQLLDAALAVARAVPGGQARLAPGAAFAPALSWPGGSRLDHVLALLGRSPDWQPPQRPGEHD
jgi:uncharacterized protein (TIGR03086 family)